MAMIILFMQQVKAKKVVVSEPDRDMLTAVSYFSFLFFFLLFFGLLSWYGTGTDGKR